MLYHYTERGSAKLIREQGVILARPVYVFDRLLNGNETKLEPAVWFTTSDKGSESLNCNLRCHGWPIEQPGMLWRFGVDEETVPLDLVFWAAPRRYKRELFKYMILTASLVGEDWETWRLSPENVPAEKWLCVESFDGSGWTKY